MKVLQIDFRRFRGFNEFGIKPRGHVLLVGESRAGKSDVLEGLSRVLGNGTGRLGDAQELDFHQRDTSARAEVEVVLGDLGPALEQAYLDQLEFWDLDNEELIDELDAPDVLDNGTVATVVRLCYRIEWDESEGEASHWIDFPKSSDPDAGTFRRLNRIEREALQFVGWAASGRVLSLAPRASFRELAEQAPGDELQEALDEMVEQLERIGSDLAEADQVAEAIDAVLASWRRGLEIGDTPGSDVVSFLPEDGVVAAILRALTAALDLPNAPLLPLSRHGSTVHSLLAHGQLIARASDSKVVAIDDFGDRLDPELARHSAALLRRRSAQLWLATRAPRVASAFDADEIVRLSWSTKGRRIRHYGRRPESKAERLAARHMSIQLLPAMSAAAVVIVEGPHDRRALEALMSKLEAEEDLAGLSAYRIALIDSGAADSSGGTGAVARIADLADDLGFRTVAVLDYDRADQAAAELQTARAAADAVIRLPERFAIERVLCDGLDDDVIRDALRELEEAFALDLPDDLDDLEEGELRQVCVRLLKRSGGLHAEFIDALEEGVIPPTGRALIEAAIEAGIGRSTGYIQL